MVRAVGEEFAGGPGFYLVAMAGVLPSRPAMPTHERGWRRGGRLPLRMAPATEM